MKIGRFHHEDQTGWAWIEGEEAFELRGDVWGGEPLRQGQTRIGKVSEVTWIAPTVPSKVLALAYNYKDLVGKRERFDEPLIFFKSPGSVILSGEPILIPDDTDHAWVEIELAFWVGQRARHVAVEEAHRYILGYTVANDVTIRNVHGRDHHLARSKALDTFCPVLPFIETELPKPSLVMSTTVDGRCTQASRLDNRILNDNQALSLISEHFTLEPGDLVLTGTPAGAMESIIKDGSHVQMSVEGFPMLENPVRTFRRHPEEIRL